GLDQRLRGVVVLALRRDGGGISSGVLDLRRQRPDQDDALNRQDLARLLQHDVGFAAGDEVGGMPAFFEFRLRPDLAGDTEALEQFVDIDAAGAAAGRIDIGDRLGRQQRALEGVDRGDVRLGRAFAHADPDADGRDLNVALRDQLAVFGKRLDDDGRDHRDVEGLAGRNAFLEAAGG